WPISRSPASGLYCTTGLSGLLPDLGARTLDVILDPLLRLVLLNVELFENLSSVLFRDAFQEDGLRQGFHPLIVFHVLDKPDPQPVVHNGIIGFGLKRSQEFLLGRS